MPRQHVDHFFVEMFLRGSLFARPDVDNKHGNEVAASLEMGRATLDAYSWPRRRWNFQEIDAKVLRNGNSLPSDPIQIGIKQQLCGLLLRNSNVHVETLTLFSCGISLGSHFFRDPLCDRPPGP